MWLLVFSLVSLSLCLGVLAGYLWGCQETRDEHRQWLCQAYPELWTSAKNRAVEYQVQVGVN